MSKHKLVYGFARGATEGKREMRTLLGGKGANLAEMASLGLPVPAGFTLTTEACREYQERRELWPELLDQVWTALASTEEHMDKQYGDGERPLLLSVRSGAAVSMPGMMDTVLNLGMNDGVANILIASTGNERFVWDCYRRFIDMFGDVVMGVEHSHFDAALAKIKLDRNVHLDTDLTAADLKEVTDRYKEVYRHHTGDEVPSDPREQLVRAICAVFDSWASSRAVTYRKIHRIQGLVGTAVNVQSMVFGNLGPDSGTGVCFSRNPATGENKLFGEFLLNAQGEDVVAGIRTPEPISDLELEMPDNFAELVALNKQLEQHYGNMQDIEFTVESGKLFILQTRNGKRAGHAAIKIAVDMVAEGLIDKSKAVADLVEPDHVDQLLHKRFADEDGYRKAGSVIASGLGASPGAAVGRVVFDTEAAEAATGRMEPVILVRTETSPEDVAGMHVAEGILTSRGGITSHAAVVARGWGKPCVAGCSDVKINYDACEFQCGEHIVREGDWISVNGTTGEVILGKQTLAEAETSDDFTKFMSWCDELARLEVRANADTPEDASIARNLGARGIGLCRTEHMFFAADRILAMREMILASDEKARREALEKLLPMQRQDFLGLFRVMDGLPVTIRLLDPPLHEFLPHEPSQFEEVAADLGIGVEAVRTRIEALQETNPMLGHRGCRLGITHPEITEMQARAIFEAACHATSEGIDVHPEVMVPLIGSVEELADQRELIVRIAAEVMESTGHSVKYQVGSMIEVPRAALTADRIAEVAEFFSFGTNDLTQMTMAYSRDDAGSFLPHYENNGLVAGNPFASIDVEGVGQLVALAAERGRASRPDIPLGVCGEHGGDPASVAFFERVGLDYVSCSPLRVPIARIAAAQAALRPQNE
jgi:pyruvate,orthophosphate dikinase